MALGVIYKLACMAIFYEVFMTKVLARLELLVE